MDKTLKENVTSIDTYTVDKVERNYVNMQVNPCKMCMPMGASQAMKGIKKSMTIIHGSQGCSTYIRRHMAAHYNEPVDIASSSLSEEGTVYGGSRNLKIGITNMVEMYKPEVVGILTTCLAETIGDDINRIVKEVRDTGDFDDVDLIPISTPGYGGSESEGYFAALKSMVKYYGEETDVRDIEKGNHINIMVSNATCEDIRTIKEMVRKFQIEAIIFPDISDVLDAPYTPNYDKLSVKGTSREDIKRMLGAKATIELGNLVAEQYSPAKYLEEAFGIKGYRMPVPIGIHNTDQFVDTITDIYNIKVPEEIENERGRLIDGMIDAHKHSALGRIAVYGDMDLVYGISSLLVENGAEIKLASTGASTKRFKEAMTSLMDEYNQEAMVLQDTDFETIRSVILDKQVNLMIGHSDGKFIWEKDGIDLIRVGFPVHDHIGAQRRRYFGYIGSLTFLDEIVNHLLDQKHRTYRKRMYDSYYKPKEA